MKSRGRALRRRYGHMMRPLITVTLRDAAGNVLHTETKAAFNSGIRASENAIRNLARAEHVMYEGDHPARVRPTEDSAADIYTRRWVSKDGRVVVAMVEKESEAAYKRREAERR